MHLIFDTETAGLPTAAPPHDPAQPRVMQIGAQLLDDTFAVRGELNLLLKWPDRYPIHPKAAEAHGITWEMTQEFGVEPARAADLFADFVAAAKHHAAFNAKFDYQLTTIWAAQTRRPKPFFPTQPFCPMLALTPIMKLPGKWPGSFKWPNLQEAHVFCTGKHFDGAHDAMADVRALGEVYKWVRRHEAEQKELL